MNNLFDIEENEVCQEVVKKIDFTGYPNKLKNIKYPIESFDYGMELEFGDCDKTLKIPIDLGSWEFCEGDIVNLIGKWRGIAVDPLGIDVPVGGEINTKPTRTIEGQVEICKKIFQFFKDNGSGISAPFNAAIHVHVRVKGLRDDIDGLKKLTSYIKKNQRDYAFLTKFFEEHDDFDKCKGARSWFLHDGSRFMPDWMCDNIVNQAENFEDFITLHWCCPKGFNHPLGRKRPHLIPLRYAVNTYCMKHIDTVEFRSFRTTLDIEEIESCLRMAELFMFNALNDGISVKEILEKYSFRFPKMEFYPELWGSFIKTKYPKDRGTKDRKLIGVK